MKMKEVYLFDKSSYHNPALQLRDLVKQEKISRFMSDFKLDKQKLEKLKQTFDDEMRNGLSEERKGCLLMENTFITRLPDGSEKGDYLSLDLGSTNFRVLLSKLESGKEEEDEFVVKYYDVPPEIKVGHSSKIFSHIANCIQDFVELVPRIKDKQTPLGFTFSFPMEQKAIDRGHLVTWTKCYDLPDLIGQDVVARLQSALDEKGLKIKVVAILNDTTGTLVKGAYLDKHCHVGLILGTGFNACYIEKIKNVKKWNRSENCDEDEVVLIDAECGAFGDNGCLNFIKTDVDTELDQESFFSGSFTYEKMFSGNFMGDIVRRCLIKLAKRGLIFEKETGEPLARKDCFPSVNVSLIESDETSVHVRKILETIGFKEFTEEDVRVVQFVCAVVSVRGALLTSAILAQLIQHINKDYITIAIDGSLYKHPKYPRLLNDFIRELAPGKGFGLISTKDGSGKGAGLVAAIAGKLTGN